jgi:molybdopterin-guanine dinucleotide biosynthesis protein A
VDRTPQIVTHRDASAAILIGGRARRLDGAFKPGLRVGNHTILERQLGALRLADIDEVMLVGRPVYPVPPAVRCMPDAVPDSGPLGGVYSALIAATTSVVVVLAGDLPFVSPALIGQHQSPAGRGRAACI